ncbi:DinB family protein [Candidatus Thorarchaeota archaeon]|nr:MAG: DinB family protein [Candidatus Thorarchaeota archaeon]
MTERFTMSIKNTFAKGLLRQYQSSWKMLRNAIENVPDEKWHDGSEDWYFSLSAYHIVETMEFYMNDDPDVMNWGSRAGFDWDNVKDKQKDVLPKISKKLVMTYLDEMEKRFTQTINSMTTEKIESKDGFHWFDSIFEKLLYLLRHNMHHNGELSRTLRDWGCKRSKWV